MVKSESTVREEKCTRISSTVFPGVCFHTNSRFQLEAYCNNSIGMGRFRVIFVVLKCWRIEVLKTKSFILFTENNVACDMIAKLQENCSKTERDADSVPVEKAIVLAQRRCLKRICIVVWKQILQTTMQIRFMRCRTSITSYLSSGLFTAKYYKGLLRMFECWKLLFLSSVQISQQGCWFRMVKVSNVNLQRLLLKKFGLWLEFRKFKSCDRGHTILFGCEKILEKGDIEPNHIQGSYDGKSRELSIARDVPHLSESSYSHENISLNRMKNSSRNDAEKLASAILHDVDRLDATLDLIRKLTNQVSQRCPCCCAFSRKYIVEPGRKLSRDCHHIAANIIPSPCVEKDHKSGEDENLNLDIMMDSSSLTTASNILKESLANYEVGTQRVITRNNPAVKETTALYCSDQSTAPGLFQSNCEATCSNTEQESEFSNVLCRTVDGHLDSKSSSATKEPGRHDKLKSMSCFKGYKIIERIALHFILQKRFMSQWKRLALPAQSAQDHGLGQNQQPCVFCKLIRAKATHTDDNTYLIADCSAYYSESVSAAEFASSCPLAVVICSYCSVMLRAWRRWEAFCNSRMRARCMYSNAALRQGLKATHKIWMDLRQYVAYVKFLRELTLVVSTCWSRKEFYTRIWLAFSVWKIRSARLLKPKPPPRNRYFFS